MKKVKDHNSKVAQLQPIEAIQEEHKLIIDHYFVNGFNVVDAVQRIRPNVSHTAARVLFNTIKKKNHDYIQSKHQEIKAELNITSHTIVREIHNLAHANAVKIAKNASTLNDLDKLTDEEQRQIQDIDIRVKTYTDRQGKEVKEEIVSVKLVKKQPYMDMLSKWVGLYSEDNKQKAPKIDIKSLNIEQLQVLNQVLNSVKDD